ncbi:MAG: hypothetical protein LAO79_16845 [Acidobacteriia bacterium]|nr:hypothetical protein [Terriglobia bacterium]
MGLWGDLPYSAEQAAVLPNLIADMNSQDLAFTAHDGDLRQGSGSPNCADNSIYTNAAGYFASLSAPAIFTPGDNDWTDCDRQSLGGQGRNSLQELDKERAFFFNTPFTMGQTRFLQEVQATPLCKGFASANGNSGPDSDVTKTQTATYTDVPCVENRRWIVGRVVYATINIQGSCNNLCDDYPDPVEYAARNAAGIQWMKDTFATAVAQNCVAVMFITQADPGFDDTDVTRAPTRNANTLVEDDAQKLTDGFHDFLTALRAEVITFGKPVAYVHGDSHYFRVDKPLLDSTGKRITNFTRVETFGDHQPTLGDVNWLKVNVDPSSREVFSYQPQIVNRDPVLKP